MGHYINGSSRGPLGVVQNSHITGGISESILRIAHAEYNQQGHSQSYERMQERGGLSTLEVIGLLADRLERLTP